MATTMRRPLLNVFAALSLLLIVGIVTLWVRSNWRDDVAVYRTYGSGYWTWRGIDSWGGLLECYSTSAAKEANYTESGWFLQLGQPSIWKNVPEKIGAMSARGGYGFFVS